MMSSARTLAGVVVLSHTIFALPFAMAMAVLVAQSHSVTLLQVGSIVGALVAARTAAMGFNRVLDRKIDAINSRTVQREIPAGRVSVGAVSILVGVASALFFASSAMLGMHCLVLSPFVLLWLFFYSYTKRFTAGAHFVLGIALALAPGGVWYALTATYAWHPIWMMCGVLCWVSGFDILYSCQDRDFDKANRLHSIPVLLGEKGAFIVARVLHVAAVLMLALFGWVMGCGAWYFLGVLLFSGFLFSQHLLVGPGRLEAINKAFFTRNGQASVCFFLAVIADVYL
jgi:4-hydroxybenzoate polyprenyltransferase